MTALILFTTLLSLTVANGTESGSAGACSRFNKSVANGSDAQKLKTFIATQWDWKMHEFPEWASSVGFPGQDDRWTDQSIAATDARKEIARCELKALQKVARARLKGEDVVNYDLLLKRAQENIEELRFPSEYLMLDQLGGMQMDVADVIEQMPKNSKKNYEDRIARLEKVPALEGQVEILLREGLKRKVTSIKMLLSGVPAQFDRVLTDKIEDSPLYKPFKDMPPSINAGDKAELQKRALETIHGKTYPALQRLREFVVKEYIPNSRTTTAWKDMPDGEAWYAYLVRVQTTTNKSPEELHQLGLREVERITAEMQKVKDQAKFTGDLKAFNKFLTTDKQFFFTSADDLLRAYRDIAKRIDPELPRLFATLPRLTYGVRPIAEYKAKEAPAAYYESGSPEAGRAGYFSANTYDLAARPKWAMEVLTMHEAVPGHHLQISLAQELKGLPEFRRNSFYTAFTEGWGLYAESLGTDLGFYKDPYSKYGALTYEMLRACRLVLDTGLHVKGWTRDQAVQYFLDHNAMTRHEAEVEVDRYMTWPGQALAYKVGQLKFLELRERAKAKLGQKFDIRKFHDEVLRHGALPLDVLEKTVEDWIKATLAQKT
jgi:uncharacterized protein (DUF885 family)